MIQSIKMKNCATYDSNGTEINNCTKVNFIYGANGSGKSTISTYLQNIDDMKYSDCSVKWTANMPVDIIVYNRDFREKNFKEDIQGVFTLGEEAVEKKIELKKLKDDFNNKDKDHKTRIESLNIKKAEKTILTDSFKNEAWNKILKVNEADLSPIFKGGRASKDTFLEILLAKYKNVKQVDFNRDDLVKKAQVIYATNPQKHELIKSISVDSIEKIRAIETDDIWNKVIIGNNDVPISKLIEHLNNSDWVNQGRNYIRDTNICPFCQSNSITEDLQKQFSDFFNGEFEENVNHVKLKHQEYNVVTESVIELFTLPENDSYISTIGNLDFKEYNVQKELLNTAFNLNSSEMILKEKEVSKKINLTDSTQIINDLLNKIKNANEEIIANNLMVDNLSSEKIKFVNDAWNYLLHENETIIKNYYTNLEQLDKAINGMEKGIGICISEKIELQKKIDEVNSQLTSVQPTVDEINRSLIAYGFTNFKIIPSRNQPDSYQICREDGSLATNTLSEGEETFITFLYFMQLAKGAVDVSHVSRNKIMVLDDPICSLDSTVLYIVSSIVKDLLKQVRDGNSDVIQTFILTHNVFFHKEVSFTTSRSTDINDYNYWVISKNDNISKIVSYEKKNPIKTTYELLWNELKNTKDSSRVNTQNNMRRILENYFSMVGRSVDEVYETVRESFDSIEEKRICQSLVSWINDGSHSIYNDIDIDSYSDSVERYHEIFKKIFINMNHEEHYKMMMNVS